MAYFIDVVNTIPVPSCRRRFKAAMNIQGAVDVAKAVPTVLVTHGAFQVGSIEADGLNPVVLPLCSGSEFFRLSRS